MARPLLPPPLLSRRATKKEIFFAASLTQYRSMDYLRFIGVAQLVGEQEGAGAPGMGEQP